MYVLVQHEKKMTYALVVASARVFEEGGVLVERAVALCFGQVPYPLYYTYELPCRHRVLTG